MNPFALHPGKATAAPARPRLTPERLKLINIAYAAHVLCEKRDSPRQRRIARKFNQRVAREDDWFRRKYEELSLDPDESERSHGTEEE